MSYAIRKDGRGWRAVDGPKEVSDNETYSETQPELIRLSGALLKIAELEASVTDRRIREAALGVDGGWLKGVDDQITALRKGL